MDVRRGLAALLCVPLLGLAGCTDDESSADPGDPTTSAAPSPTPTESSTEPSIPPEAQGTDEASAKAFVRHWFVVFSRSMNNGETSELEALSSPGCRSCDAFTSLIKKTYDRGGRIESERWNPGGFSRLAKTGMAFDFTAHTGAETFYGKDGAVKRQFAGGNQPMTVKLVQVGSSWRIQRLAVLNG